MIETNLKYLRGIKGLSQAALAELIGESRQKIDSYESGRAKPKFEVAKKIAEYFNIPIEDLYNMDLTGHVKGASEIVEIRKNRKSSSQKSPSQGNWDSLVEELKENNRFLRDMLKSSLAEIQNKEDLLMASLKAVHQQYAADKAQGNERLYEDYLQKVNTRIAANLNLAFEVDKMKPEGSVSKK